MTGVRGFGVRAARLGLVLVLLATFAGPLSAQDRGSGRDRGDMEERIRLQMQRVMAARLQLSEEESRRLTEVVRGFEENRRELRRSELAARRRVEALLLEGGTDDEEADALLARIVELRRTEAELFAEEQEALLEVLPAAKVLRLQMFREEMGRRIRALRRGGEHDRLPPGAPPGVGLPGNAEWLLGVDDV